MKTCGKCGQVVTPDNVSAACAGRCGRSFHATCAGLFADVHEQIRWWCWECSNGKKRKLETEPPILPAEIWIEIFEHLPSWQLLRVREVCHRWKFIVNGNKALKAKFTARFEPQFMDREYYPLYLFPAAKIFMRQVKIAAVGSWWAPLCAGLTHISMDECKIMLRNLLAILKSSPNLKYLDLSDVTVECHEDNPIPDFRLDKLETLYIDGVNREENLLVFQQICPNVKSLKIAAIYNSISLRHVVNFVDVWHNTLEQLEIDGTDLMLIELAQLRLWNLKELTLQDDEIINVNPLINFCRLNPGLVTLNVESAISYILELDQLGQLLPKLTNLMLTVRHSAEIQSTFLIPLAATLRILQLSCDGPENEIVNFAGIHCPSLEQLNLNWIKLEGSRLQKFLANSPNLRVLSLTECRFSSWTDVFRAVGTCKRLRQLTIYRATITDNSGDHCFLDYLDEMRHLELRFFKIPQEVLATLLRLCPRLELLTLEGIRNVIDEEIVRVLSKKLHHLEQLTILHCELSDHTASSIRKECHVQHKLEINEY